MNHDPDPHQAATSQRSLARSYFAALLLGAPLALLLIHPSCDLLFGCGCTFLWAGAAAPCNIHHPAPPHCPWCSIGTIGFAAVCAVLLGLTAALATPLIHRLRGRDLPAGARLALLVLVTLLSFALAALLTGAISALAAGYPRFLGLSLVRS